MNGAECQELVDTYLDWLRNGIKVEQVGEACEFTTPFLYRHNDHLQIYAIRKNGRIVLTDDGETIGNLASSGVDVSQGRRKELLGVTLRGFGVKNSPSFENVLAVVQHVEPFLEVRCRGKRSIHR